MAYLENLSVRLALGASALPEELRGKHAAFLLACQNPDGGFAGRKGGSDAYYTGFALRSLAMLGALQGAVAERAGGFIKSLLTKQLPSVDFLSLVSAAVLLEVACGVDIFTATGRDRRAVMLETAAGFRRPDGGFAKTPRGGQSSTYHTMLMVLGLQMVGAEVERPEDIRRLVRSRQREDGGFVELAPLARSGTNPTAAAVAVLLALDGLDPSTASATVAFLKGMQTGEGGFTANTLIPLADLLSTFTAITALGDLDSPHAFDAAAAGRFVAALEDGGGGFRAGSWDDEADVEYTFYGLGSLALLGVEAC